MKLLILAFVSILSCSKDDDKIIGIEKDKIFRSPVYLQNPSTDGMTIMWQTNVPCHSWVEYGTDSLNMQQAQSWVRGIAMVNNTLNRIRLTGLEPGTRYYYRVCSREVISYLSNEKVFGETATSKVSAFSTFDDKQTDFTALIFNDLHNDYYSVFNRLLRQVTDISYDIVFFNGDCVEDPKTEDAAISIISKYSKGIGADLVPSVYVWGNHEYWGAYSPFLSNLLGMMDGGYSYGSFNIGDTRFVILDCGVDLSDDASIYQGLNNFAQYHKDQAEFLRKEVATEKFMSAAKRVLIHHIPIYGVPERPIHPSRVEWGSILEEAPFDICLNAHIHGPLRYVPKGTAKNNYPVVFGGGSSEKNAYIMILRKQGDQMTLTARNVNGEILLSLEF